MKAAAKEKPILFSSPMVRAILEGKKTQTRRVLKPQPETFTGERGTEFVLGDNLPVYAKRFVERYSPWQLGTHLWVRETFLILDRDHWPDNSLPKDALTNYGKPRRNACVYRADCDSESEEIRREYGYKWRPSIRMPHWASRLTLEVTDVRVERLQEISEEDAQAEGVGGMRDMRFAVALGNIHSTAHRLNFIELWDKLNGPRGFGWDANPWVFVIAFKRI